jgi:hypothetical protein
MLTLHLLPERILVTCHGEESRLTADLTLDDARNLRRQLSDMIEKMERGEDQRETLRDLIWAMGGVGA